MNARIYPERLAALAARSLGFGSHPSEATDLCLLETVAWLAGEPHSDRPRCACPVISAYGRAINDNMGNGAKGDALRAKFLRDLAPRLVGTRGTRDLETRRAYIFADAAVRVFAPLAIEAYGRKADAARFRALPEVKDAASSADAAYYAAAADAAAYAAYAAAR